MRKYLDLWVRLTTNSFLTVITSRFGAVMFFIGKFLRFLFFLGFLLAIFSGTSNIAGYTVYQAIFFFLSFNFLDTLTQLFFREVYRFRELVVTGDFDLVLVKPMSSLFRALAGGADPIDLFMLIPYLASLIYTGSKLGPLSLGHTLEYLLLLANGFLIATAFHICVLSVCVLSTEIDHTIMIYRDITNMGRIPVDVYREPLRSLLLFIIPVGMMMTVPTKALLGLVTLPGVVGSCFLGVLLFGISLRLWRFALTKYGSASS